MNNLFGLDIDDFDRSYPGVYGAYKQNCKDPDIPCCTGVCQDICKSSGKCINGWNDSCGSSCELTCASNEKCYNGSCIRNQSISYTSTNQLTVDLLKGYSSISVQMIGGGGGGGGGDSEYSSGGGGGSGGIISFNLNFFIK